jgi:hypothetical protein
MDKIIEALNQEIQRFERAKALLSEGSGERGPRR